ncbi:MAG: hypothetical protein GC172_10000 [Phycisphaera sp.]|nr:hypothetical protein [Phycisphaera sp.]
MQKTRRAPLMSVAAVLGAMAASLAAHAGDECVPGFIPDIGPIGPDSGLAGGVAYHDDGNGPEVYVGGSFTTIGGVAAPRIVKVARDKAGTLEFTPLGTGLSNAECYALASFQGSLYAAGYFDLAGGVPGTAKLARWDGSAWNSIGAQLELFSNQLWGLTVWNSGQGDNLYIAGNFQNIGGTSASYIARYDGKAFHALGTTPIAGNVPLIIFTSHVHDDGTGPALYVGGRFTSIDGVAASRIARWNGTSWSAVGSGVTGSGVSPSINTMVTFDDGTGPALYVGGQTFVTAGGVPANRVAKWDGKNWSAVGDGFANGIVWKLAVYNDGTGDALYAFGTFTASGATPINRMAKWNGTSWEQWGGGANGTVFNALVIEGGGGDGADLLALGGQFTTIGTDTRNRIAAFEGCPEVVSVPGDLDGDGVVNGADLSILLSAWGSADPTADIDGDGSVGAADLSVLLGNWG